MTKDTLDTLAYHGAIARVASLKTEINGLEQFIEAHDTRIGQPIVARALKARKKRSHMSPEMKKKTSLRMKAYWAKRKKLEGKGKK